MAKSDDPRDPEQIKLMDVLAHFLNMVLNAEAEQSLKVGFVLLRFDLDGEAAGKRTIYTSNVDLVDLLPMFRAFLEHAGERVKADARAAAK